jgi:hypothetical protein
VTGHQVSSRARRRAAATLALAALAAGGALALRNPDPGLAALETETIAVRASLDSCTEPRRDGARSCHLAAAFDKVADAEYYEAAITAPDGSHLLTAPAEPSGSVFSVPYVGDGTYRVRITAYGSPAD